MRFLSLWFCVCVWVGSSATVFADPPVARDDDIELTEGEPAIFNLFADNGNGSDFDADGDHFFLLALGRPPSTNNTQSFSGEHYFSPRGLGELSFDENGNVSIQPTYEAMGTGEASRAELEYIIQSGQTTRQALAGARTGYEAQNFVSDNQYVATIEQMAFEFDFNADGNNDIFIRISTNEPDPANDRNFFHYLVILFDVSVLADGIVDLNELTGANGTAFQFPSNGTQNARIVGDMTGDGAADIYFSRNFAYTGQFQQRLNRQDGQILLGRPDAEPGGLQVYASYGTARMALLSFEDIGLTVRDPLIGQGDINNDGLADLLVPYCRSEFNVHPAFLGIVLGSPTISGELNLFDLITNNGSSIALADDDCRMRGLGTWLEDRNGDGVNDFILPIDNADGGSTILLGYGVVGNYPSSLTLLEGPFPRAYGFTFFTENDHIVKDILSGGDFNGNGRNEFIFNSRSSEGNNFVTVLDSPSTIDFLAGVSLESSVSNGTGFTLRENGPGNHFEVFAADRVFADLNDDPFDDFLLRFQQRFDTFSRIGGGLIYGRDAPLPAAVSYENLSATGVDTLFDGPFIRDNNRCVRFFGGFGPDLNADGTDDVFDGTLSRIGGSCRFGLDGNPVGAAFEPETASADIRIAMRGVDSPIQFDDATLNVVVGMPNLRSSVTSSVSDEDLLDQLFVSAVNGDARLVGRWIPLSQGGRMQVLGSGEVYFDVYQEHRDLARNEIITEQFTATMSSTGGDSATATFTVRITGSPVVVEARPDFIVGKPGQTITGNIFSDNGAGADYSESGQAALYRAYVVRGPSRESQDFVIGERLTLNAGGELLLNADGSFEFTVPQSAGAGYPRFPVNYFIRDAQLGSASQEIAYFSTEGINDEMVEIQLNIIAPPREFPVVSSGRFECEDDCLIRRFADEQGVIQWSRRQSVDGRVLEVTDMTGPCADADYSSYICRFDLTEDTTIDMTFAYSDEGDARVFASVLPAARSMEVGGAPATIFATIANSARTVATNCLINTFSPFPMDISFQRTDAANQPIGTANELVDIPRGGLQTFVVAFEATGEIEGVDFFPQFRCSNGSVTPIRGVNSVFLSASDTPVPDILSIGATPSGDGVIRIPSVGGISFMSAAAINIGAGDPAPDGLEARLSNEATITVTADTGLANLPLTIEVCETDTQGRCLAPRSADVTTQIGDSARTFAVFVRASGDQGVAFDPANARVYLRFTDSNGVVRSVTSAAVTAPAPESGADIAGIWALTAVTGDQQIERQLIIDRQGRALMLGESASVLALRVGELADGVRSIELADPAGGPVFAGSVREGLSLHLTDVSSGRVFRGVPGQPVPASPEAGRYILTDQSGAEVGLASILADGSMTGEALGCGFAAEVGSTVLQETGFAACEASSGIVSVITRFDFDQNRYRPALVLSGLTESVFWMEAADPS